MLVALHGASHPRSDALDAAWRRADVASEISDPKRWIALRLEDREGEAGAAYRAFVELFPARGMPAVVALNPNDGSKLFERVEWDDASVAPEALLAEIVACREAFEADARSAALAALARLAAMDARGDTNPQAAPAQAAPAAEATAPAAVAAQTAPAASAPAPSPAPAPAPAPVAPAPPPERPARPSATPPSEPAPSRTDEGVARRRKTATVRPDPATAPAPPAPAPAPPAPPAPPRPTVRARLPDGSNLTTTLDVDATIADVRAFIVASASASALPRGGFDLWNAWPRRRVDESAPNATIASLGLGARPSILVLPRDAGTDEAEANAFGRVAARGGRSARARAPAAAAGGGFLDWLVETLRRVWAAISLFLGLGDLGVGAGGVGGERERGGGAEGTPVNTQEAAWAAATRGVEASRARGGGGGRGGGTGGGGGGGTGGGAGAGASRPGEGPRGNIRTLGSSRDDDDDGRNRFDNGNSTVWGGGGGDDGDDGRGGGAMDVF